MNETKLIDVKYINMELWTEIAEKQCENLDCKLVTNIGGNFRKGKIFAYKNAEKGF